MVLNANALISVDDLFDSMGLSYATARRPFLDIYNSSADATSATILLTSTGGTFTVVGGVNASVTVLAWADVGIDTIGELVAYLNALGKGWVATRLCPSAMGSSNLTPTAVSCLLIANRQTLLGFDALAFDELINMASQVIETYCRRKFISQVFTEYYDGNGSLELPLDNFPVSLLTSLQSWEVQMQVVIYTYVNHMDYELYSEEGIIYSGGGFSRGHKNFKVVYTAGFTLALVPSDLKEACKILCKRAYNLRSAAGIASERIGEYSISYAGAGSFVTGMYEITGEVQALIAPYKRRDRKYD